MRLTLMILLTLSSRWLTAGEAIPDLLLPYGTAVDALVVEYQTGVDQAQRQYTAERAKLDGACITALLAVAKREARKSDKALAVAAWREVLRLDGAQAEATASLTAIGLLEQVQGELAPPTNDPTDLLTGPVKLVVPEVLAKETQRHQDGVTKARAIFAKAEGIARQRFRENEAKLRTKAVKDLSTHAVKADKAGNLALAAAAWKAVLTIERDDAAARAYFTGLGRLESVLKELPEVRDPLGDPPDPDRGFAPLSFRGLKIAISGPREAAKRTPLEQALHARCTEAGMVVTAFDLGSQDAEEIVAQVQDQQLVVLLGDLGDSTRGKCINIVRTVRVPMVIMDHKLAEWVGLSGGTQYNSHLTGFETGIAIKADGHPLAAGMTGTVRLIDPLPNRSTQPVTPDQDPDLLKLYAPLIDLPTGAVVVAGLAQPRSTAIAGYETGLSLTVGESKTGAVVTIKLPARRIGNWMLSGVRAEQTPRLSREWWRLWDAGLTWALRGTIAPAATPAPAPAR